MPQSLPVSRLVNVQVILSALAAQSQNLSTLLVLGSSSVIDTNERLRSYGTLSAVAADFGTTAPEYYSAALYFGQSPQPSQIKIGRWAKTATNARLVGATLSTAQQAIANFNTIANGSFDVTINGTLSKPVPATFVGATNLNGIAAIIQTAVASIVAGSTFVWNATLSRFELNVGGAAGATSTVSFASVATTGSKTDISALLGMTAANSGAYTAQGIAAETAVAAAALFDAQFGQGFYALTIPEAVDADHLAVAALVEGLNAKHVYGVSTQAAGVLVAGNTSDIAYQLKALGYKRTIVQFSSNSAYSVASLLGRAITVDYTGNSTVITLMFKQEPGIVAETLTETQVNALEGKGCNVFVAYQNSTAIIEPGVVASGDYIDVITGTDWLAITVQTAVYNLLYTSPTKIPQTDSGSQLITTTVESVLSQAVANGLLAPGVWDSNGFGNISMGDFLPKGFYVYAPPVALQLKADRAARKSVPIQVAAKLSGAVHSANVTINVSR